MKSIESGVISRSSIPINGDRVTQYSKEHNKATPNDFKKGSLRFTVVYRININGVVMTNILK
jgi:hypothetical protein